MSPGYGTYWCWINVEYVRKWVIVGLEKSFVCTFQKDTGRLFWSICAVVEASVMTPLWEREVVPYRKKVLFIHLLDTTSDHLGSYFVPPLISVSQHVTVAYCHLFYWS